MSSARSSIKKGNTGIFEAANFLSSYLYKLNLTVASFTVNFKKTSRYLKGVNIFYLSFVSSEVLSPAYFSWNFLVNCCCYSHHVQYSLPPFTLNTRYLLLAASESFISSIFYFQFSCFSLLLLLSPPLLSFLFTTF